jgi:hypothetical protein
VNTLNDAFVPGQIKRGRIQEMRSIRPRGFRRSPATNDRLFWKLLLGHVRSLPPAARDQTHGAR